VTNDSGHALRRRGEDRVHHFPRRQRRVLLRLSDQEYDLVQGAAWRDGYTMAGYAAEATLASAGGHLVAAGNDADRAALRDALAELMVARTAVNRFGANVNQAVAALNATGAVPVWLGEAVALCRRAVEGIDETVAMVRRGLTR
jgi:hypothetical protein